MLPIFCNHLSTLTDRKEYCLNLFNNQNLKINWVEEFDPDLSFDTILKPIKHTELSLILKSKFIYETQLCNKYQNVLIFEDDIILPTYLNFNKFLEQILIEFEETQGDICFIGGTRDFIVNNHHPTKIIYYDTSYYSRGTHAYIVNLKCVETILKNITFMLPLDHLLNSIIKTNNLKCGWTHPYIEQWTDLNIKTWKSSI